jgi:hypothetical protein
MSMKKWLKRKELGKMLYSQREMSKEKMEANQVV